MFMVPIKRKISPYNHYNGGNRITYIVIHGTDNVNDTAKNNADYFSRADRGASAHYFVDDNEIWQSVEDCNGAWHVGDGHGRYGITNSNSIGIEMCGTDNGNYSDKTVSNAIDLAKYLANKYGIPHERIVRHYDASRKNCPSRFSPNNWSRWYNFKSRLDGKVVEPPKVSSSEDKVAIAGQFVGSRCAELQSKLIKLGYDCGGFGADGIFGKGTYDSIRKFQADHGLAVDGLAGKDTFAKLDQLLGENVGNSDRFKAIVRDLQSELNKQCGAGIAVDGIPGPATLNACIVVKSGARGNITKCVQRFLMDADINVGAYGADGVFGQGTVNAVKTFQSRKRIGADGIVGHNTWRKLLRL